MTRLGTGRGAWIDQVPWHLAARLLTAVFGGYAFASACAICVVFLLPVDGADAVTAGLLSSFVFYAGAIMWAFAVRSAGKACVSIWGATLILGLMAWMLSSSGPAL